MHTYIHTCWHAYRHIYRHAYTHIYKDAYAYIHGYIGLHIRHNAIIHTQSQLHRRNSQSNGMGRNITISMPEGRGEWRNHSLPLVGQSRQWWTNAWALNQHITSWQSPFNKLKLAIVAFTTMLHISQF